MITSRFMTSRARAAHQQRIIAAMPWPIGRRIAGWTIVAVLYCLPALPFVMLGVAVWRNTMADIERAALVEGHARGLEDGRASVPQRGVISCDRSRELMMKDVRILTADPDDVDALKKRLEWAVCGKRTKL